VRQGRIFKRCGKCGLAVRGRSCERCGSEASSWCYVVDLAPPGAPRQQRLKGGFATKAQALAALNELQAAKAAGTYVEPTRQTIGAYLVDWLHALATTGEVRRTTWKTYDVAVRVHIVPRLGGVPLQQLTRPQIKALYQKLIESGRADGATGGLSPKSVHLVHLCLHRALQDAVEDGLVRSNPAHRAHKLPAEQPDIQAWSAAELRTFLASVEGDDNYALWRLAASTGMRRGELLGLRWSDVDLEQAHLSVRQQLVREANQVRFGPPKTRAGRRLISLDATTVLALRAQQRRQKRERLACGPGYANFDLVFCRADGTQHDPDDLRHTHATLALQAGIHPKVVQERLGHSSISVTLDLYSHVTPTLGQDAASRIAALVDGKIP
jgi:integrase